VVAIAESVATFPRRVRSPRLPGGQAGSAALYVWPAKASRSPKDTAWLGKSLERAIAAVVTYEAVLRCWCAAVHSENRQVVRCA
jgi:hypothetical protein